MSDSEETTGSQASPPLPSQPSVAMQAAPFIQGITLPKPLDTPGWGGGGVALGYFLGGYVPPGTPEWHPVLEKISPKIDTPF